MNEDASLSLCPVCGKDDHVRKVTFIFNGMDTRSSLLAMKLKPPAQPFVESSPTAFEKTVKILFVLFLVLFFLFTLFELFIPAKFPGFLLPAVLITSVMAALTVVWNSRLSAKYKKGAQPSARGTRKSHDRRFSKWHAAMERYEKLYFCYRDSCVFIPEEKTHAGLDFVDEYIYQGAK